MYTNCLLLGLDPSVIGVGGNSTTPRVGSFRHSNPKLGEQLLYFILSSLRGPIQSGKDFDKVWPIFDSAQSRDFRKVVQGIINELESQGALPRSNSRVSSLATCCGPRNLCEYIEQRGLDPSVIGVGGNSTTPRVGSFRHSNPKLGEQLLYFILSSLRGPIQSGKDFDKVWPIFDSAQSRDFRKVVQGIINELESQGALPRSNSRVSSLATCCGPRFVELLWQLSLHALREVHRRTFPVDVASNPLPASLTDVAFSHAATLLPVTKARIALERRKFLKNTDTAVRRQAMWSNLAHEMTAEFRGLCAEEVEDNLFCNCEWDLFFYVNLCSSGQNSHLISKATRLWESLLARKSQHEILASGPIEDLIAHREHRYRISGSALLSAMDQSSQIPYTDVLSVPSDDIASAHAYDREPMDSSIVNANREKHNSLDTVHSQASDDIISRVDDRSGRSHPTVDIAEVLRRWTHALQRIHKQSLQLAKANNGEGPELLRSAHDGGTSGHAESLAAVLAEHRQHLASIQVLSNQLKESAPALQQSISELTEEVNNISSTLPPMANFHGRSTSPVHTQSSGRIAETGIDEVSEVTSKLSTVQLEKASVSPALKLPQLFSLNSNYSGKGANTQKRHQTVSQANQIEIVAEGKSIDLPLSNNHVDNQGGDNSYVHNLRRSVREAALSMQSCNMDSSHDDHSHDGSEHFLVPFSGTCLSQSSPETKFPSIKSKRMFESSDDTFRTYDKLRSMLDDTDTFTDYGSHIDGFFSTLGSKYPTSATPKTFYDMNGAQDQGFSPPLLMDTSLMDDSYEDLLAPLSETDTALMERSFQFWVRAADIYTGYKVFQFRVNFVKDTNKQEVMWERQHEIAAEKIYSMCSQLGGFFLKAAQIIGKPDLAPNAWVKRLVTLCDRAPSTPFEVVQLVFEKEFGRSVGEIFERFDMEPLGSASIAQVHRARLKGAKGDVAVKVQHPGVQDLMMVDIHNLQAFASYLQKTDIKFDLFSITKEMEKQIGYEFDFLREAAAMERIRHFLALNNKKPPVLVPGVVRDMVTRKVLVMDFMDGIPILNLGDEIAKRGINPGGKIAAAAKQSILKSLTLAYGQMILKSGFFHADPHPGNILICKGSLVSELVMPQNLIAFNCG
ncbi:Augmin subunit [Thalictrum thalictroides]|uniref:Augmin subunit n=1 Tax=Thalictrum thalictroides TaxID=46969 RepID=A0A7J6VFT7_THATH|nr:Augmin subunit [Thalictrum thalictroides]